MVAMDDTAKPRFPDSGSLSTISRGRASSRYWAPAIVLSCLVSACTGDAGEAAKQEMDRPYADRILFNGKILTLDSEFTVASALAIKGDRIIALGKDDEITSYTGDSTETFDLEGRTVIPGLIDNHVHGTLGAFGVGPDSPELFALQTHSMEELLELVRERVGVADEGEWVITTLMSPKLRSAYADEELPTRQELDALSPRNPVFLRVSGNTFILNSAALEVLGVDRTSEVPTTPDRVRVYAPQGGFHVDDDGEFTGFVTGRGWPVLRQLVADYQGQEVDGYWTLKSYPVDQRVERLQYLMRLYNKAGVTSFRDMSTSRLDFLAYERLWEDEKMTVRVNAVWAPKGDALSKQDLLRQIRDHWGPKSGFGDKWLRVGGIKIHNWGEEKVREGILEMNRWEWTLSIHHGMGLPFTRVVDILEEAHSRKPLDSRRYTIEHGFGGYSNLASDSEFTGRLRNLGLIVAPQPEALYFRRVADPSDDVYMPIRDWLDAGLIVTGGQDHPGLAIDPEHPLRGLYAAVARRNFEGETIDYDQRVTREEALRLYTVNGAYALFEEHLKGSLEAGKLADLVVLSDDYLSVPEEEILDIRVVETIVGGETVFRLNN